MKLADKIRRHSKDKYVLPARQGRLQRFSIRAGDVVHEMKIGGDRAPAVCSALKTREFLRSNNLQLVEKIGPKSGQSTTVTYTYEFVETGKSDLTRKHPWAQLRGALKNVFEDLGGGETYLRNERDNFYPPKDSH